MNRPLRAKRRSQPHAPTLRHTCSIWRPVLEYAHSAVARAAAFVAVATAGCHDLDDPPVVRTDVACNDIPDAVFACPQGAEPTHNPEWTAWCSAGEFAALYEGNAGVWLTCARLNGCPYVCQQPAECACGEPTASGDGWACPACAGCGDGVCDAATESADTCAADCSTDLGCREYERCMDDSVQTCGADGTWTTHPCGDAHACVTALATRGLRAVCVAAPVGTPPGPLLDATTPEPAAPERVPNWFDTHEPLACSAPQPPEVADVDGCAAKAVLDDGAVVTGWHSGPLWIERAASVVAVTPSTDAAVLAQLAPDVRFAFDTRPTFALRDRVTGSSRALEAPIHDRDDDLTVCRASAFSPGGAHVAVVCHVDVIRQLSYEQLFVWSTDTGALIGAAGGPTGAPVPWPTMLPVSPSWLQLGPIEQPLRPRAAVLWTDPDELIVAWHDGSASRVGLNDRSSGLVATSAATGLPGSPDGLTRSGADGLIVTSPTEVAMFDGTADPPMRRWLASAASQFVIDLNGATLHATSSADGELVAVSRLRLASPGFAVAELFVLDARSGDVLVSNVLAEVPAVDVLQSEAGLLTGMFDGDYAPAFVAETSLPRPLVSPSGRWLVVGDRIWDTTGGDR